MRKESWVMAYNIQQKLSDNIAATKIALEWKEGNLFSSEQSAILKRFSGFGGIKAVLYPYGDIEEWRKSNASKQDLQLYASVMKLHELLKEHFTEDEYKRVMDSVRNSILTAYYTPQFIPETLFTVLKEQGIHPQRMYEPSSGAGIFVTEAIKQFNSLESITAVEKDILTARILKAITANEVVPVKVHADGFEETGEKDNGGYDLVVSNIPFGNFPVYDPSIADSSLAGKIHNYFFAKGLDKTGDGGLLAYITTDGFLNNPSNESARNYLFSNADFISVTVMPDNLMKETGNTEAPSHLLIVQKNENKQGLSEEEELLLQTTGHENEFGKYQLNAFISRQFSTIQLGDKITEGKNQYGTAHRQLWQTGNIAQLSKPLHTILTNDFNRRFRLQHFERLQHSFHPVGRYEKKAVTYLPAPERKEQSGGMQLGLFDTAPAEAINRAMDYLTATDILSIEKKSARVAGVIKTNDQPEHESIVLVAAKARTNNNYYYRLYSNIREIGCNEKWQNGESIAAELEKVRSNLAEIGIETKLEGERRFSAVYHGAEPDQLYFTDLKPHYREGTLVFHNQQPGSIHQLDIDNSRSVFHPFALNTRVASFYQQYIHIRDTYFELFNRENETGVEHNELRDELNRSYDRFLVHHGLLNQPNNRKVLLDDSLGFITLSSLERKEGEKYLRSDIFQKPLFSRKEEFKTDNPAEALARCLNDRNKVDISYIASATNMQEEEAVAALGDMIFINPHNRQWETKDKYLSGNVVVKLEQAREAVEKEPDDPQLQRSLHAIEQVQPASIPFELLDFNFGERWIPLDYYNRFASELFEQKVTIAYLQSADVFKVSLETSNAKVNSEFAVKGKSGQTLRGNNLLEHALENTNPVITYEKVVDAEKVRVADNEAIQLAHEKIETIRNKFAEWLTQLPAGEKKSLEQLYNNTFNCYVLRQYDGSHLQFHGLDKYALGIADLYDSQKNAVWRLIQQRGGLIDHEVGLGKTLTMVAASHEMKRLGILNKPMIIGLKANIPDIAATYRNAYPNDRILFPHEEDFSPANRQRLFHNIKNNNWDCIIISHDQFGKIPQSPAIQQIILQEELANLQLDLDTMKEQGGDVSRAVLKGLEIRRNNLIIQLKTIAEKINEKKDSDIDFEELGIDHLFVDEAHKFKNLTFTTRHNRVAGLGNTEGSQRALNMLFAIRTLQKRFDSDLNATFLTGTPISNSLTELYLVFKYLRPNELSRQRIENFDAWAAVFARKSVDFEFSVTNEIIAKERFRHFIKVPELALFYNEITDYKTASHIKLDKPGIEETLVNIKPSELQEEFIQNLIAFAKTGDGNLIGRDALTEEEDKGRMLIATNYAKKMSVDMRLIDPSLPDDPKNKISVCAKQVADIYKESMPHRGTQLVFCDIGTPKKNEFNLYDALKAKLVKEYNIPASEIAFIHDWEKKRTQLFRLMNNGMMRISIGSTEKLGTGVNVQERMVATHHLDIPWTPKDLEQRNGRAARQGNIVAKEFYGNKVANFIYATERSLDNYKFSLLKNKITFISQMKNGDLSVRTIDEGAIDKNSGMNFSEYIAILSGDTTLLEKAKVEKEIAVIENLKVVHFRQHADLRTKLSILETEKEKLSATVAKLASDYELYKSNLTLAKDGSKNNPVKLDNCNSADPAIIGRYLLNLYDNYKPADGKSQTEKIGTLYGFDLYIRMDTQYQLSKDGYGYTLETSLFAQRGTDGIKYTYNNGVPNADNPLLAARYFLNAIDRVGKLKEQYEKDLANVNRDIPVIEGMLKSPFEKEDKLRFLKTELKRLELKIAEKIALSNKKEEKETKVESKETPVVAMKKDKKKAKGRTTIYCQSAA